MVSRELENAQELIEKLFGKEREFLNKPGAARTPFVNNITKSAVFTDQYGRLYSFADPSEYEYEDEPAYVDEIALTDCLYVAISNEQRHASNVHEYSVPLDGTRLPEVDEQLLLTRRNHSDNSQLSCKVFSIFEPSDAHPRISSGWIQIDGFVQTYVGDDYTRPQAILESLLHR